MISDPTRSDRREAFIWIWLPDATEPVVAGRLYREGRDLRFNYGRSYLARDNAIAIYDPELPLRQGAIPLTPGLTMPNCLRDAAPDAWGRRVILNRLFGADGLTDVEHVDELTYLLASGSHRIGALDFQESATVYVPREAQTATIEDLMSAAALVEAGERLPSTLADALQHGTSIGGARPKALISSGHAEYIVKFSSSADLHDVVKGEYLAMRLATKVGLSVANVALDRVARKDVLLVERFDRVARDGGWARKALVSALTLFELDEMMARYASYETLAEVLRRRAEHPVAALRELFGRLVFNVLCGNTDDHARNHAVFWTGERLVLTPAYDICPQARSGETSSQAMLIHGDDRSSRLSTCLMSAPSFLLHGTDAEAIVEQQIETIVASWSDACDEAQASKVERSRLWRRVFLNPFAFHDAPAKLQKLLPA